MSPGSMRQRSVFSRSIYALASDAPSPIFFIFMHFSARNMPEAFIPWSMADLGGTKGSSFFIAFFMQVGSIGLKKTMLKHWNTP